MRIKVELSKDEIRKLGFTKAMNYKWLLESMIDVFVHRDKRIREIMEVINEVSQKN